MKIIHTLKDGTVVDDITGHVVKYEDCPEFYDCVLRFYIKHLAGKKEEEKEETKKD